MVDVIVQRGAADRPAADIVEPLLATIPAALARGKTEMDHGEPADAISLTIAPRDVRLGETAGMSDPVAGRWVGKVTGVQHRLETDDAGHVILDTTVDVEVPRASRQ